MGLTFYADSTSVALEKIRLGKYKQNVLDYLKEDNGQISWGLVEKWVDSETVYDLFELDSNDEFVDADAMNSLKPSKLALEFKNMITEAYLLFQKTMRPIEKTTTLSNKVSVTIEVNQIGENEIKVLDGMPMVVIYENPPDIPNKFVGRLWSINVGESIPTNIAVVKDSLNEVRQAIKMPLIRMVRDLNDDEKIVEVWI